MRKTRGSPDGSSKGETMKVLIKEENGVVWLVGDAGERLCYIDDIDAVEGLGFSCEAYLIDKGMTETSSPAPTRYEKHERDYDAF